jgi:hypothetical protein
MCILAYGFPTDIVDEYVQITESTTRESLEHFCHAVISTFGKEYLCSPNTADVACLLQEGEAVVFPVCSVALILCTGSGRTALVLGRAFSPDMRSTHP